MPRGKYLDIRFKKQIYHLSYILKFSAEHIFSMLFQGDTDIISLNYLKDICNKFGNFESDQLFLTDPK